jgi:phage gpG-like protein
MTPEQFQQRLNNLATEFKTFYAYTAPAVAGEVAVRLFKENFQTEGFFGDTWKEVKRRESPEGESEGESAVTQDKRPVRKKPWQRRKILTGDSGDLGRSITAQIQGDGTVLIFTDPAAFHSKEPYGRVHNEGLRAGRGSGFTMPQRRFIGDHPKLRQAIIDELEKALKIIKN